MEQTARINDGGSSHPSHGVQSVETYSASIQQNTRAAMLRQHSASDKHGADSQHIARAVRGYNDLVEGFQELDINGLEPASFADAGHAAEQASPWMGKAAKITSPLSLPGVPSEPFATIANIYAAIEHCTPKGPPTALEIDPDSDNNPQVQETLKRLWKLMAYLSTTFPHAWPEPELRAHLPTVIKAQRLLAQNILNEHGSMDEYLSLTLRELRYLEHLLSRYYKAVIAGKAARNARTAVPRRAEENLCFDASFAFQDAPTVLEHTCYPFRVFCACGNINDHTDIFSCERCGVWQHLRCCCYTHCDPRHPNEVLPARYCHVCRSGSELENRVQGRPSPRQRAWNRLGIVPPGAF